ncbi:MAG: methyltransferase family protein [Candidatus Bathyarchaeia archaeon]
MNWKWSNVPVPEACVAVLVVGVIVHLFLPLMFFSELWLAHVVGWPLIAAGVLVVVWAVRTVKDMDISKPTRVISTGPYAFSRNPMYVSWMPIYVGIAFIINTVWLVLLMPAVLIFTHYFIIIPEEQYLERRFGDDYRRYRDRVRRYL